MNIFRMTGDACHVWSMIILLRRLVCDKNAHGISTRSQVLYLLVFVTRYLDLFTTFYSYYNSFMKIFYICTTVFVICAIQCYPPLRETWDKAQDTLAYWKLLLPSFVMATSVYLIRMIRYRYGYFDTLQLLWTFSICLEAIAILPQLFLVLRYREIDTIKWIYDYILFKGLYRAIYIVNWIYRSQVEVFYRHHLLVYTCGVLQTLVYADFLLFYCKRVSLIRWMALGSADAEYVDSIEGEYQGGQFELLLEDGLLSDDGDKATMATNGDSSASQRDTSSKQTDTKDAFITILE